MLSRDTFGTHDRRLQAIYPFLMGLHSRPLMADCRFGRPRLNATPQRRVKVRLVCPAALGTLMCPHKPESLHTEILGLPMAEPDGPAESMACCSDSSSTVYLTEGQLKMAQWDLIPGSWEHTLYYEAARSLTEQRFSLLKSTQVAGLIQMTTGPRRTPMIKILIALAAATVNIRAQQNHDPTKQRAEAIDIRLRQLAADLGHPPPQPCHAVANFCFCKGGPNPGDRPAFLCFQHRNSVEIGGRILRPPRTATSNSRASRRSLQPNDRGPTALPGSTATLPNH